MIRKVKIFYVLPSFALWWTSWIAEICRILILLIVWADCGLYWYLYSNSRILHLQLLTPPPFDVTPHSPPTSSLNYIFPWHHNSPPHILIKEGRRQHYGPLLFKVVENGDIISSTKLTKKVRVGFRTFLWFFLLIYFYLI